MTLVFFVGFTFTTTTSVVGQTPGLDAKLVETVYDTLIAVVPGLLTVTIGFALFTLLTPVAGVHVYT